MAKIAFVVERNVDSHTEERDFESIGKVNLAFCMSERTERKKKVQHAISVHT